MPEDVKAPATGDQSAAQTANDPSKTGSEATGAQDDGDELDKILADVDAQEKAAAEERAAKAEAAKAVQTKATVVKVESEVLGTLKAYEARAHRQDVNASIEKLKNSSPALKGVSGDLLEARLELAAAKDPRIKAAWQKRIDSPETWDKTIGALAKQFAKEFPSAHDPKLSADAEAARASVSGRSSGADSAKTGGFSEKQWVEMSPAEFEKNRSELAKASARR